ncbi:efflux RND transporter periplasmic adaptor subunit [Hydrogenothermus marinus]|uniref:RND family efflux transporter MFP subunit n=1 Tax=Hydrogenothermus marinus TaxID=133270 RepID=A0A3M0B5N9_9AQUI|nr:efflux RND transporter periplasmic adaptor subunit [Hydrogenothermus marinus]RMA92491.1 RND family efflux transporter MFP subunit [Hydrogenothermus marinus]
MKGVIKFTLFFILPIALFILWLGGFFSNRIQPGYAEESPKVVSGLKVIEINKQPVSERYKIDGYTTSKETANVATKIMGKILKEYVKEGDYVKKGQLLAVIDTSDIKAQKQELLAALKELKAGKEEALAGKKAAEAQLHFMQITYKRLKNLYEENAIPKQKVDEIEMKLKGAQAQVDQVNAKLKQLEAKEKQLQAKLKQIEIMEGYGYIRAPFNGYIVKKMIDTGSMASPGMPIFIIGNKDIEFQSFIDAKYINNVKKGDTLSIYIEPLRKSFKGKVIEKNSNVNPMNNSFSIKVDIPDDMGVGLYGYSYINVKKDEKILIPKTAISRLNDTTAVFIVDKNGILHLTPVDLGEEYNGKIEVKSGITEGQKIVVSDVDKACDGCRVSF